MQKSAKYQGYSECFPSIIAASLAMPPVPDLWHQTRWRVRGGYIFSWKPHHRPTVSLYVSNGIRVSIQIIAYVELISFSPYRDNTIIDNSAYHATYSYTGQTAFIDICNSICCSSATFLDRELGKSKQYWQPRMIDMLILILWDMIATDRRGLRTMLWHCKVPEK